jgi:glucosamine--fructose-6-phosphate aminotransferase (isomerizing)
VSGPGSGGPSGADVLNAEIAEQPEVLERLRREGTEVAALGRRLAGDRPRLVRLAGHGTSDNVATYGVYAFARLAGGTAIRDSISLPVYEDVRPDAAGDLAVGLSQSGETPDVVRWLEAMREAGALAVAVTNDANSALARAADVVLRLRAGEERSVAATKTYTAELAVVARLAAYAGGRGAQVDEALAATAESTAAALAELPAAVERLASELSWTARMVLVGRGLEFATAREVALKLTELCQVGGVAMTATDLAHGPVAALDERFPVWACVAHDNTLTAVREAAARAREAGAPLIAAGPSAAELEGARALPVPAPAHPVLSPLLTVLPGQLFAVALARAKGLDPGAPRHLRKVTLAT